MRVPKPERPGLFLTGGGEAYRKTIGGTKKLSGPAVHRRAVLIESLVRERRVLWVDDQPSNNFYERLALSQIGLRIDVAGRALRRHPDHRSEWTGPQFREWVGRASAQAGYVFSLTGVGGASDDVGQPTQLAVCRRNRVHRDTC